MARKAGKFLHTNYIEPEWVMPPQRFNNEVYILERLQKADKTMQGNLRSALSYLYVDHDYGGPCTLSNLIRNRVLASGLLEQREEILLKYLFIRTNGSEKYNYDRPAIIAAKKSRYKCQQCSYPDVRVLCLDHTWEEDVLTGFMMLCQNCHSIKSRQQDWKGEKTNKNKREAVRLLKQRMSATEGN